MDNRDSFMRRRRSLSQDDILPHSIKKARYSGFQVEGDDSQVTTASEYDTESFTGRSAVTWTDPVDGDDDVEMLDRPEKPSATNIKSYSCEQSSGSNPTSKEVCFGALCDKQAAFSPRLGLDKKYFHSVLISDEALKKFPVEVRDHYYALKGPKGIDFAILDLDTTNALNSIKEVESLRFQAVTQGTAGNTAKIKAVIVSINIYGMPQYSKKVGSKLGRGQHFLQHPDVVDDGISYDNPHYFKTPGMTIDLNRFIGPRIRSHVKLSKEALSSEVEKILDSLDVVDSENGVQNTDVLRTSLLRHQEVGVKFIRHKEDSKTGDAFWVRREEAGLVRFEHQISGHCQQDPPRVSLGGILADVMGLGKTLTMLSAIALSIGDASHFMQSSDEDVIAGRLRSPAKATLVVVPSAQLMDVWRLEIKRHFTPNCFNVSIFHGSNRVNEPKEYSSSDLVLTTYSTLSWDHQNACVLHRLKWFRIILDEAHWIRNQDTKQFRAANSLHAERRWCLTGTPIQNRLDDLGSLVHFLKVDPFVAKSSKANFKKYIVDPLFSDHDDPCGHLRLLLRSLCLRRTGPSDSVLRANTEQVELTLSKAEQSLYERILEETKRDIDRFVSTEVSIKYYTRLFTSILRLRIMCDQGTFCERASSTMLPNSGVSETSPNKSRLRGDLFCDVCQSEESLDLMGDDFCWNCSRLLPSTSAGHDAPGITQESWQPMAPSLERLYPANKISYPGNRSPTSLPWESCISDESCSTKLSAIVENLTENLHASKSIVFSCWKKTLDILGKLLRARDIQPIRVDGDVSYPERLERLAKFQQCPEASVLLMTYGTGAVGLNLTAANRIHIVEPQWNPCVEEQAIGRALRLGQSREVTVLRYVMKSTVEQNIIEFQKRKEKLAKFTFDGGLEDSLPQKLEEMKFILYTS